MSFWKKIGKEINRMAQHSQKAGQTHEVILKSQNIGGEIIKFEQKQIANFSALLQLNDLAMQQYPQLRQLAVGEISIDKRTIQKHNNHRVQTAVAVKKINQSKFRFTFVQIQKIVQYSEPKAETVKDITQYFDVAIRLGGCKTHRKVETVGRPLTEKEKQNIEERLESFEGPSLEMTVQDNLNAFEA